jgi:hypothetical protein
VPQKIEPGPPMDLANMRQNGVRSISVHCIDCGHEAIVNLDAYPDHVAVPSSGLFPSVLVVVRFWISGLRGSAYNLLAYDRAAERRILGLNNAANRTMGGLSVLMGVLRF